MLVVEYDVTLDGVIELVALINAVEADVGAPGWTARLRDHGDGTAR